MGSSPTRGSSFFLGKVTALGVLCCFALFACLTLLASFFLPSHLSLKTCIMAVLIHLYVYTQNASSKNVKIALVGNKIDLESDRTVSTDSGKAVGHIILYV